MNRKTEVSRRDLLYGAVTTFLLAMIGKNPESEKVFAETLKNGYRVVFEAKLNGRPLNEFLEERRTWSDRKVLHAHFQKLQTDGRVLSGNAWVENDKFSEEIIFRSEEDWNEFAQFIRQSGVVNLKAQANAGVAVRRLGSKSTRA